jgi:hypothetical protein
LAVKGIGCIALTRAVPVHLRLMSWLYPKPILPPVTPVFFDAHVCSPPATADLVGREMDFECRCGRRWRLEHYFGKEGSLLGPSWILL